MFQAQWMSKLGYTVVNRADKTPALIKLTFLVRETSVNKSASQ